MQYISLTWRLKQDGLHQGLCTWQMSLNGCQRMHIFATIAATSLPVSMFRRNELTPKFQLNPIDNCVLVHRASEIELKDCQGIWDLTPNFWVNKERRLPLAREDPSCFGRTFWEWTLRGCCSAGPCASQPSPSATYKARQDPNTHNVKVHLRYISQESFGAKVMWEMDMDAWKA